MNVTTCPKTPNCPIFNGILKGTHYTETYRALYCLAGQKGQKKCKRFLVAEVAGKCPDNLLPNSTKSVEAIVAEMKVKGAV